MNPYTTSLTRFLTVLGIGIFSIVPDFQLNAQITEPYQWMPAATRQTPPAAPEKLNPPSIHAAGTCADMGGENGWSVWEATVGTFSYTGTMTWKTPGLPTSPRFTLTSGTGNSLCTPAGGGPPLPEVAPGFGSHSIQLGQTKTNGSSGGCGGGCMERATFDLLVTPADTNFIYAFAIVLQNPAGHTLSNQPFAMIYMLDQNGDTVDCSYHKYMGDTLGGIPPGMFAASCGLTTYLPWTFSGINLGKYVGQVVTVVLINADCAQGGHFCHSYWDFSCPPVTAAATPFCVGQSVNLSGPASTMGIPYTYTWYQNHVVISGAVSQAVTVMPAIGDTFSLYVQEPSGCGFWMVYAPQPTDLKADFSGGSGSCSGSYNFSDNSTVLPASSNNSIVNWSWQFPGGSPASSNQQNPGAVTFATSGTHTVTLIVTSSSGCKDTIQKVFSASGSAPTAAFSPSAPCLGSATSLTDGSVAINGDPITSWSWSMPGGTPATSTSQNPLTTYLTAGSHSVTLIVESSGGCIDTITQQVLVYNSPVANFGPPVSECSSVTASFNDLSTSTDGAITNWQWSFPGGNPSTSTSSSPTGIYYGSPGTYSVSLVVSTTYGCKDTLNVPMVTVYSTPQAGFCVDPLIQPATNPVFTFCDQWSSDVTHWTWDFGDNDSDHVNTDPVHSYSATANNNDFYSYQVCIRVENQAGCWDTTCKTLELTPEFSFYIPNTFTPNGDNLNEMFFGKSRGVKEYTIWIFDRWGNQIWDCNENEDNAGWDSNAASEKKEGLASACKWDGVVTSGGLDMNGKSKQYAQEDVYIWKVKLTDIFNRDHDYVGQVNVVR